MNERLHESFELAGFVDRGINGAFLLKSGSIGQVIEIRGRDTECLDDDQILEVGNRFETAVRSLDHRFRLYQYQIKNTESDGLFCVRNFMILMLEPPKFKAGISKVLSRQFAIESVMTQTAGELRVAVERLVDHLGNVIPAWPLDSTETFQFFSGLMNYDQHRAESARLSESTDLAWQLTMSDLETYRGPLLLGDTWFKVLSLKAATPERALPDNTVPDFLRTVRLAPVDSVIVTEYHPLDPAEARSKLDGLAEHHHLQKFKTSWMTALANMVGSVMSNKSEQPAEPRKDVVEEKAGAETEKAIENAAFDGIGIGEFALTVIVRSTDKTKLNQAVSKIQTEAGVLNLGLFEEQATAQMAWFSTFPGGHDKQRHHMTITERVYADMSLLYAPECGNSWNDHLNAPCVTTFETKQSTRYDFNFHVGPIGHLFMLGMTGYGKTYLCNHLIRKAKAKYDPIMMIFDMKEDYREETLKNGGSFVRVGERGGAKSNPLSLEPTQKNLEFMNSLVSMLVERDGFLMDTDERTGLWREIEGACSVFPVGDDRRRLGSLLPPPRVRRQLEPWIGTGAYGWLFDNTEDTLSFSRWQAFSFDGLNQKVLEPMLFHILHLADARISSREFAEALKLFLIDEAWLFFKHPAIRAYIHQALKTWRYRNAAVMLATQSADDIEKSEILETILESIPTRVLLGNPGAKRSWYKEKLGVNDTQFDHVITMARARDLMVVQGGIAKIVQLKEKTGAVTAKAAA